MWTLARPVGYFAAGVTSSLVLTLWMTCIDLIGATGQRAGLLDALGYALSFWPYFLGGTLLLMSLPWCLVVWLSRGLHWSGPAYFAASGAVGALFALGTSAWIFPARGHPTFLDAFALAIENIGLAVVVSGAVGGLTYSLCSEGDDGRKQT
jgi:hypothetical protein